MKKCLSIIMVICCIITGCGFHLRGLTDIPKWLNQVAVVSKDGNYELVAVLKSRLDSYGIEVCDDPIRANYLLIIESSAYQTKIISIGASTNPRQYQMLLTTRYQLQNRKGELIKSPGITAITRQLTMNNDRILGSNDEETTLLREMRQDTVTQILNTISRD